MMKRSVSLFLILALCLPVLTQCGQPAEPTLTTFDTLARWVPRTAEQPFFLNFKPSGEAGRHWQHIRRQLEANPAAKEALDGLLSEFKVEEYGLEKYAVGPAVSGYESGSSYVVLQVGDEADAEQALRQHFEDATWEQDQFEGTTIHYGKDSRPFSGRGQLAWAFRDGHLFLITSNVGDARTFLKTQLGLLEEESLTALPGWQRVRVLLPEDPMGIVFVNVAEKARLQTPAPGDTSLSALWGQHLEAMALAAVPEREGMRVEIRGTHKPDVDPFPQLQELIDLPAVDPSAWAMLPADTSLALFAHDASLIWPVFQEMLGIEPDVVTQLPYLIGLDLGADLAGADGPLTGDLALAFTPPLPDQPVIEGLTAAQLLIATLGASRAEAHAIQTAMEGRGAVFAPTEVEGVVLQTQVGTEPSGYAFSYGFEGDNLLLGSSPDVIGQAVAARRDGVGLVTTEVFETVLQTLPDRPAFAAYLDSGPLVTTARANMTADEYQKSQEFQLLEAFEAIALGLRLEAKGFDGVLYFLVP